MTSRNRGYPIVMHDVKVPKDFETETARHLRGGEHPPSGIIVDQLDQSSQSSLMQVHL
jgi:hypothetical protein